MEWQIELTGSGLGKAIVFTWEQLACMPMTQLTNVVQRMTHFPDETTSWRGPALDALLAEAGIKPGPMRIMLEAADGYHIECTREDLDSAIVALQDGEGQWLVEAGNRRVARLVLPHKTGDYWVSNPRRLVVEPLCDTETPE